MRGHPLYDKETGRSDGLKRGGLLYFNTITKMFLDLSER